jgi:hypothetical protein
MRPERDASKFIVHILEETLRKLTFFTMAFFLMALCIACGRPADKDASGAPDAKAPEVEEVDDTPVSLPPSDVAGADASAIPPVATGDATGEMAGGTTTTLVDDQGLKDFAKAVVMEDREQIKNLLAEELADRVDETIEDLGFSEFLDGNDYEALWARVDEASMISMTGIGGGAGVGMWQVNGKDVGLKDLMVELMLTIDEDGLRITSYTIISQ